MRFTLVCLIYIVFGAFSIADAQSVTKCFEADRQNNDLRQDDRHSVEMTVNGGKVSGFYHIDRAGSDEIEGYPFEGTLAGTNLKVKFTNQTPDVLTASDSYGFSIVPTPTTAEYAEIDLYRQSVGKQLFRINFYNGQTKKLSGSVDYFPCYTMLARTAKPVNFAKGASSAKIPLSFKTGEAKKVFSLSVGKGQFIGAVAFNASIEIYFPNGDIYAFVEPAGEERNTTSSLDNLGTDLPVPANGNALFVLTRAGENSSPKEATFFVTNTQKELDKKIEAFFK